MIYIGAVPAAYAKYQKVCEAARGCDRYWWYLTSRDVIALEELGLSVGSYATYTLAVEVFTTLVFWTVGTLIFWRKSDNWVALLISLMLVTFGAANVIDDPSTATNPSDVLGSVLVLFGYVSFFAGFYLFPDGRFVPRWTRWLVILWVWYIGSTFVLSEDSPLNPGAWALSVRVPVAVVLLGTMVFAQVYRYLRVSGTIERQQTRWIVFGFVAAISGVTLIALPAAIFPTKLLQPGVPNVLYSLVELTLTNISLLLIPMSMGVAILRYRLWDMDIIVNRSLVYGALTATVVGLYVLVVGGLGSLVQDRSNLAVSLGATAVVALLFAPLRDRLQRGVNHLMYGERDEPYKVLSGLGERLETALAPKAVLPALTESVATALKLPYSAISLKLDGKGFAKVAEYGEMEAAESLYSVPLTYQRETVGELLLAPRAPEEGFSKQDLRLLHDLSRQIGMAAHNVRLTGDLQRSRERLVTTREEERRRLRRDLHDGVGPQLAALMLELETASEIVSDDPEASALMAKLSERTRTIVSDVRRSVHALRPPALDELGLVGALSEAAAQYSRGSLSVSVEAPENLSQLPAATEVACYRIAQEGMTNVVRHADASNCWVRIDLDEEAGTISVAVEDDGRGIGENKAGVGMTSMRERAEELGGRCTVRNSAKGGTLVRATLPYGPGDAHRTKE